MNKIDFATEKIGSVHMTVFEIVVHRNVDSRSMALILPHQNMVQTAALTIGYNY